MSTKNIILSVALCLLLTPSFADANVRGYYRNNGTYVQPHHRSNPNGNPNDNWSTKGNTNPYTGREGTHNPNYNHDDSW